MSTAELDAQIDRWRRRMHQQAAVSADDVDEMESHLRDQVADLAEAGLSEDEGFLVAMKRLGAIDSLSDEFAREHSERLWKQLAPARLGDPGARRRGFFTMLAFAVLAALSLRIGLWALPENTYATNIPLLVLPFLAAIWPGSDESASRWPSLVWQRSCCRPAC